MNVSMKIMLVPIFFLAATGILGGCVKTAPGVSAKQPEDTAPAFSLRDQHGQLVSLDQITKNTKGVVIFFRGVW